MKNHTLNIKKKYFLFDNLENLFKKKNHYFYNKPLFYNLIENNKVMEKTSDDNQQ